MRQAHPGASKIVKGNQGVSRGDVLPEALRWETAKLITWMINLWGITQSMPAVKKELFSGRQMKTAPEHIAASASSTTARTVS